MEGRSPAGREDRKERSNGACSDIYCRLNHFSIQFKLSVQKDVEEMRNELQLKSTT